MDSWLFLIAKGQALWHMLRGSLLVFQTESEACFSSRYCTALCSQALIAARKAGGLTVTASLEVQQLCVSRC